MYTAIFPLEMHWNEVKALELCSSIGVSMSVGSVEMQHEICIQLSVLNESLKTKHITRLSCLKNGINGNFS